MILPGETEAGSAGMQPCRGIAWRAHRDDDRKRGLHSPALLSTFIGSKDPDALKIPARRAEFTLTEDASSPVHAEPEHRLLQEAIEARRASVRPHLHLTVDQVVSRTLTSTVGDDGEVNTVPSIRVKIRVTNCGRGPALLLQGRCWRRHEDGFRVLQLSQRNLQPLSDLEGAFEGTGTDFELKEETRVHRNIELSYQDAEGHLYRFTSSHWGQVWYMGSDKNASLDWLCDEQLLQIWPFEQRSGAWSGDTIVFPFIEPLSKGRVVFHRKQTAPLPAHTLDNLRRHVMEYHADET